jgi:hypothetical protein
MGLKMILAGFLPHRTGHAEQHTKDDIEAIQGWTKQLQTLQARLDEIVVSSGNRFLTIGEKLQEFYRRSQDMSDKSSTMVDLLTGEGLKNATDGLSMILDELRMRFENPENNISRTTGVFTEHLNAISKVNSYLDDFNMIVMNLIMLGFLTQVENAYIFTNNTGFASLTDDVRSLAETIRQKAAHIRSKSETVQSFLVDTLSKVSDFEKIQSDQARIMLENAFNNQRSLKNKHSAASGSSTLIDKGTRKIASNIGDIVMSLQFHDITRQQIEHVKEVFDHIDKKVHEEGHTIAEKAAFVRDVSRLQQAQLAQSRDDLTSAVLKIINNLRSIGRSVGEIINEAHEATMASETSGTTFMEEIDLGISSVIQGMRLEAGEQAKLTDTVSNASEMASEMSMFVKDIETLGLHLQLIALNARIKAAHLGREGAALDTISGSIYELSINAREDTRNLGTMLSTLVTLSTSFNSDFKSRQGTQKELTDILMEKLKSLIASLHEINITVISMLTDLTDLGKSLMMDIEETASHIGVHKEFQDMLNDVLETVSEITDDAEKICPEGFNDTSSSFLADIDKLYTMQSEREVHMRNVSTENATLEPGVQGEPANDLGDNVELF